MHATCPPLPRVTQAKGTFSEGEGRPTANNTYICVTRRGAALLRLDVTILSSRCCEPDQAAMVGKASFLSGIDVLHA